MNPTARTKRCRRRRCSGDPFGPPAGVVLVECLHCERRFRSSEMVQAEGLWWCKHYPACDGAGFGFDIFEVHPDDA